mgnify:CR=1 FL=1
MAASGHVGGGLGDAAALSDSASRFPRTFPRTSMRPVLISHICMHSVSLSIPQITSYQFLLIDITISRPYSVQQTKRVGKWEFRKEPRMRHTKRMPNSR